MKFVKHLKYIFFILPMLLHILSAGIADIESYRKNTKKNGTYINVDAGGFIVDTKNKIIYLNTDLDVVIKASNNIYFFFNKFDFVAANGEELLNGGYNHIRYNRLMSKKVTGEVFLQSEYENVYKIFLRSLIGFGPIVTIYNNTEYSLSTGFQYLLQVDQLSNLKGLYYYNKLHLYTSSSVRIFNYVNINNITSYIPRIIDPNVFKIITESSISTIIRKTIKLKLSYSLSYDTEIPDGQEKLKQVIKPDIGFNIDFFIKKKNKKEKRELKKKEKEQKKYPVIEKIR